MQNQTIFIQIETFRSLSILKKAELENAALNYSISTNGKTIKSIIHDILEQEAERIYRSGESFKVIEKDYLLRVLSMRKKKLLQELNDDKEFKKYTRRELLSIVVDHMSRSELDDNEYFEYDQRTGKYQYNDLHIIQPEIENIDSVMKAELNKHIIPELSNIVVHYVIDAPFDQELETVNERAQRLLINFTIRNEHRNKHCNLDDHECTYEGCMNVMQNCQLYDEWYYRPICVTKLKYADKWGLPGLLKLQNQLYPNMNPIEAVNTVVDKEPDKFSLSRNWYSQVRHLDSKSVKAAVIEMKKMIQERYSKILKYIKFGAINDQELFERSLSQIKDNDIDSLNYFQFLLSTRNVYFIDRKGHKIYAAYNYNEHSGRGLSLFPGFYSAIFLLESNSDDTLQISPVNFGVLTSQDLPHRVVEPLKATKVYSELR